MGVFIPIVIGLFQYFDMDRLMNMSYGNKWIESESVSEHTSDNVVNHDQMYGLC